MEFRESVEYIGLAVSTYVSVRLMDEGAIQVIAEIS